MLVRSITLDEMDILVLSEFDKLSDILPSDALVDALVVLDVPAESEVIVLVDASRDP